MVEGLAGARPKEERLTEAEGGKKADACIRYGGRVDGRTGPCFMSEGDVRLIQVASTQGRDEVEVKRLDVCWAFDAVGRCTVCGDVKGLVGIPRIVKVIRPEELVLRVDRIVHATEEGTVMDNVIHRLALILVEVSLVEVDEHLTLAVAIG